MSLTSFPVAGQDGQPLDLSNNIPKSQGFSRTQAQGDASGLDRFAGRLVAPEKPRSARPQTDETNPRTRSIGSIKPEARFEQSTAKRSSSALNAVSSHLTADAQGFARFCGSIPQRWRFRQSWLWLTSLFHPESQRSLSWNARKEWPQASLVRRRCNAGEQLYTALLMARSFSVSNPINCGCPLYSTLGFGRP